MTLSINLQDIGESDTLEIHEHCQQDGIWLADGVVRPRFAARLAYAPESRWVGGKTLLSAVPEIAELQFNVICRASTPAVVQSLVDELERLLWQFNYNVTLDTDGSTETWAADPSIPEWGRITLAQRALHYRIGAVSIPVNPRGAP